jgi:hypothetical protein
MIFIRPVLAGPFQSVSVLYQLKVSQIDYLTKASKKGILGLNNSNPYLYTVEIPARQRY